jgi:hypothetical protein
MVPVLANHQITPQDFLLALGDAEKFRDAHVTETPELAQVATEYASGYTGRFPFMCEMRQRAVWGLSPRQAAAVLNCLKAEVVREQQATVETSHQVAPMSLPAAGIYTLSNSADDYVTIRIRPEEDKPGIAAMAEYLAGPANTTDYIAFAFIATDGSPRVWSRFKQDARIARALRALLAADGEQRHAYGFAYAEASGRCMVCGRTLTTPESIASGIGPTCAGRDN